LVVKYLRKVINDTIANRIKEIGRCIAPKYNISFMGYNHDKRKEIQKALKELEKKYASLHPSYPKGLCFVYGEWREKYLYDMNIC
jgi:hypothetical protein